MNDKFSWELLFDSWNDVSETETHHLLACCKWYLVWSLRTLTDSLRQFQAKELFEECVLLLRKCNEFVSTCFNMLQHLQGQRLHFEVYECLCDFYIMYSEELESPIKINKHFEKLCPKLEDKALQNLLALFLEQRIINNPEMDLSERRANVVKYVNLVHLNILPVERLGHIFKYYYSHNADYEPIIESSLKEMSKSTDDNAILLVVLSTLTMVYEDILRKHNVVDITTDDARNLKFLVKQFLTFQYFRTPKRHFKKLLYFSVMYVIKDESKYAFLYFIRYFTNLIVDVDDQKEIYDFLKQKLPDGAEKNDAVLFFATHMKTIIKGPETSKEVRVKPKVARKTKENIENAPKEQKNKAKTMTKAKPQKAKEKVKKAQKKTPVKKVKTPVRSRKRINKKKSQRANSETEMSEDSLTIHDSESDIEGSMSVLRI